MTESNRVEYKRELTGQEIVIYKTKDGKASVALYARDGDIWLNQNQLAELFAISKQNIGQHIENILEDNELDRDSVVKNYFTTAVMKVGDGADAQYFGVDLNGVME